METQRQDTPEAISRDVAAISRISAVPAVLRIVCQHTGMRFAAVARVTEGSWVCCAVLDDLGFGLKAGARLDVNTTLCKEGRESRVPVAIDQASTDPVYHAHHTPRVYGFESYISVPILLGDGQYFGNLCAIDSLPAKVSDAETVAVFKAYAELIGQLFSAEERHDDIEATLRAEQERSELREQFIAVLGHDLRNPLSAVSASAELMVMRGDALDVASVGRRIRSSVLRMSNLIDDVMDFARGRLGAGIGVRLAIDYDLRGALQDVVGELVAAYPGRAVIELIDIHQPVRCDRGRMQQLLSNLLGNALHHGAASEPIRIEAGVDDAVLTLVVTNGGAPIDPEHLAKVFDPYWRPPRSRQGGGLGLGLHICSQIVRAHGGQLEVLSNLADGTRFIARMPVGV